MVPSRCLLDLLIFCSSESRSRNEKNSLFLLANLDNLDSLLLLLTSKNPHFWGI
jgi:hypothetical protein